LANAFPHLVKPGKKLMLQEDRNKAIEKDNMNLYMKMKAILLNSKDSQRMQANPV